MNELHHIVLDDETVISATLNGNNYITTTAVPDGALDVENTTAVTIDGEEIGEVICTNYWHADDGYHIIFHPVTEAQKQIEELRAQIDFLMMMGGYE